MIKQLNTEIKYFESLVDDISNNEGSTFVLQMMSTILLEARAALKTKNAIKMIAAFNNLQLLRNDF